MLGTRHSVTASVVLALAGFALGACSSESSHTKSPVPSVATSGSSASGTHSTPSSTTSASTSASASTSSSSSTAALSQSEATSSLKTKAGTAVVSAVRVGDGYEGASADSSTMHFWRTDASGAWVKDGDASRIQSFSSVVKESIEGAKIRGGDHAAFILHADLGGTGSSSTAQAFGRAADGWGGIASTTDDGSTIALKHSAGGDGTWHSASFSGDLLKLGSFVPGIANADGHDVTRSWAMNGTGFTLVATEDPSTKAQHFTAGAWGAFTSPSGKNLCQIMPDAVSCVLSPSVMASHGGNHLIGLNANGWGLTQGDLGIDEDTTAGEWATTGGGPTPDAINGTRILSYGSTISDGDVTCTSTTNGFSCSNSVAGFTVNTEALTSHGRENETLAVDD